METRATPIINNVTAHDNKLAPFPYLESVKLIWPGSFFPLSRRERVRVRVLQPLRPRALMHVDIVLEMKRLVACLFFGEHTP